MTIRKLWVVCWKIKKKQQENGLTSHLDAPWRCDQMICKAPTQYTAEPAQKLCNVHKWLTHSSVCRPVSIPPLKKHNGKIHRQFKHRRKTLKRWHECPSRYNLHSNIMTLDTVLFHMMDKDCTALRTTSIRTHTGKTVQRKSVFTPASLARGRPIWFNSASISSILLLIIAKILGIRALITASRCCSPETRQHLCFAGAAKITTRIYKRTSPTSAKIVTRYLR